MIFDWNFFFIHIILPLLLLHSLKSVSLFFNSTRLHVCGMSGENWFLISCKNSNCLWNKVMSLALIQADPLSPVLFLLFWLFFLYVFSSEITIVVEEVEWMKGKKNYCWFPWNANPKDIHTVLHTIVPYQRLSPFLCLHLSVDSIALYEQCFVCYDDSTTYLSIGSVLSLSYTVANGTPKTRSIMCT